MFIFGSIVADAYARLAAHPISAAAVGCVFAVYCSWLLTKPRGGF